MDILQFVTADGETLTLPNPVFAYEVLPGNFGAPPTNYIERQGYKQDGTTELDYNLAPRDFDLDFWRAPACDRQDYWDNRLALLEYFRPNRGGQIQFILQQPDGTRRALYVRATPGPTFPGARTNDWNIRETISFRAFDPIFFNPTTTTYSPSSSISSDLVFPITFPIQFGASGVQFTQAITYTGTWRSFPTLRVDGPYTSAVVTNLTTGISIFFTVAISTGQYRVLDLTPGAQTLTDENGDDAFGDLGPLSNLVDFNLRPDPEVAGGAQTIQAILYGGSGSSGFTISYNDRFFGI